MKNSDLTIFYMAIVTAIANREHGNKCMPANNLQSSRQRYAAMFPLNLEIFASLIEPLD
jgi:hypothetical protein